MMATNYTNKQNLENHWLTPTILKVVSASGSLAGTHPALFSLAWVMLTFEPTFKTWYISRKSPDPQLLGKRRSGPSSSSVAVSWDTQSLLSEARLAHSYSPQCPARLIDREVTSPTSVGLFLADTARLLWSSLE